MKKILFTTDFSKAACNAGNFALSIAKKLRAEIILFNAYQIPVFTTDNPPDTSMNQKILLEDEILLQKKAEDFHSVAPEVPIEYFTSVGFTADEILFNADKKNIDLIVMGIHGAGRVKRFFMGSNTALVVNKANCAVLAVPEQCTFNYFRKIAFATDCEDSEIPSIKTVAYWATKFNSSLILVHISNGHVSKKTEGVMAERFLNKVKGECNFPDVQLEMKEGGNIADGLVSFLDDKKIDLLAMAHHKRTFLSQLNKPSISRKISFHLPCPLLALPA